MTTPTTPTTLAEKIDPDQELLQHFVSLLEADDPDEPQCLHCGEPYVLHDGCDPTSLCDACAQVASRLLPLAARLAREHKPEQGERTVFDEVLDEQRHGRQKYGRGPDDLAHDDTHSVADWIGYIKDHADRAAHATPMEARQHLIKSAGLAISAVESMDRKRKSDHKPDPFIDLGICNPDSPAFKPEQAEARDVPNTD